MGVGPARATREERASFALPSPQQKCCPRRRPPPPPLFNLHAMASPPPTLLALGALATPDAAAALAPAPFPPLPAGARLTLVPGGFGFACVVVQGGTLVAGGQFGAPAAGALPTESPLVAAAAGYDAVVVVDATGAVYDTGIGRSPNLWERVPLPPRVAVSAVAAGARHAAALDAGGTVWCWCGAGDGSNEASPAGAVAALGPAGAIRSPPLSSVACGALHTLAGCSVPTRGGVWAWGSTLRGQCGVACASALPTPTPVPALAGVDVVAVAAGACHSLAQTAGGGVVSWGAGAALGRGGGRDDAAPAAVALGAADAVSISAGASHSIALDADGGVWLWGRVGGAGADTPRAARVPCPPAAAAAAGWWHALILTR